VECDIELLMNDMERRSILNIFRK